MFSQPLFISYSRKDCYFAESLAYHLCKREIPVRLDAKDLKPGVFGLNVSGYLFSPRVASPKPALLWLLTSALRCHSVAPGKKFHEYGPTHLIMQKGSQPYLLCDGKTEEPGRSVLAGLSLERGLRLLLDA